MKVIDGINLVATPRILHTLKRWIGYRSSINRVAAGLGLRSHASLSRMLNGETSMKLETAEAICRLIDIDLEILHREVISESILSVRQATQLLTACDESKPAAAELDSLLNQLDERLSKWLLLPKSEGSTARRGQILTLDHCRINQPRQVETTIGELITAILAEEPTVSNRADLAMALAVWGALQRFRGRRARARAANLAALRCLGGVAEPFVLGFVFRKIAFVVFDYDRPEFSQAICSAAAEYFFEALDLPSMGRTLIDKGCLFKKDGQLDRAERELQRGLALLAKEDLAEREVGLQCLAEIYRLTSRLPQALETLFEAEACSQSSLSAAFLAWRRAQILMSLGRYQDAALQLRPALAIVQREGEPIDAALASIDLAIIFLTLGRHPDLRRTLSNVDPLIGALASNREAQAAVEQIACLAWRNELSKGDLAEGRRRLESAGATQPPA